MGDLVDAADTENAADTTNPLNTAKHTEWCYGTAPIMFKCKKTHYATNLNHHHLCQFTAKCQIKYSMKLATFAVWVNLLCGSPFLH